MSPRLALAKPLTASGHGSGKLTRKGDHAVAFSRPHLKAAIIPRFDLLLP